MDQALMTVRDAAARIGGSTAMVYALVASGRLRCYRIGAGRGTIRITEGQVADYLASVEQGARPSPPKAAARPYQPKHLRG